MIPIAAVKNTPTSNFNQDICNYTVYGREIIHKQQKYAPISVVKYLMENPIKEQSVEYNDNRLSLYVGQGGRCFITKQLLMGDEIECHHKNPKSLGGTDEYKNLVIVHKDIHKLIHVKDENKINEYMTELKLDSEQIKKLNKLRCLCGNKMIA